MLPDSGHIQETETEWKNRKRIRRGEEELVPIYDAETAAKSLELFKGEPYNQIIELDDDIHVRFNDAGHMLGSSTIEIWIRENGENKKIVFSGDLGNNDIPLLAEPTMIQAADFSFPRSSCRLPLLHRQNMPCFSYPPRQLLQGSYRCERKVPRYKRGRQGAGNYHQER